METKIIAGAEASPGDRIAILLRRTQRKELAEPQASPILKHLPRDLVLIWVKLLTKGENDAMYFVLFAVVILLLIVLVAVIGSPDRYAKMSEKEFEQDAERGSLLGAAMLGVAKALRPDRAEQVLEQKQRVEKDATPSGDAPSAQTK
jgi:hypothetical protein